VSFDTAFFLRRMARIAMPDMHRSHSGNAALYDEIYRSKRYNMLCKRKGSKMLKHLFRTMIAARQASAAMQALQYMSDRQLEDIGFTRETFVEKIKADVFAELDAAQAEKVQVAPVNPNLVGAV
jgi:uncharacterized protein YjiS (DUF1127 family)